MKKSVIFSGVGCALITPFRDGAIDFPTLKELIEIQIESGTDAIIIGGTTGECATLSDDERYRLFSFSRAEIKNRCKLVFGTGTNDTKAAVRHTMLASRIGCDGVLAVTPYYNKGTEGGIVKHYLQIAEASTVPVLLYNVPSRTGVNLSYSTLKVLSEHQNIVGIKEASDSLDRYITLASLGDELSLYAGNDTQIFTTLSLFGRGVISVMANLYPREVKEIYTRYIHGDREGSLATQLRALPLTNALFKETNPAPIKYAMSASGLCSGELRLPLSEVSDATKAVIEGAMKEFERTQN